jgi:integrase
MGFGGWHLQFNIHSIKVNPNNPMLVKQFHYISKEESQMVLESINTHKVIVLNVGCRFAISEACSIKCKNFDFKIEILQFSQLKKEGEKHLRTIPISNRLYQQSVNI